MPRARRPHDASPRSRPAVAHRPQGTGDISAWAALRRWRGLIDERPLAAVEARGKHLLVDVGDVGVHIQLGLAGSMFQSDPAGELGQACGCGSPSTIRPSRGSSSLRGDEPAPAFCRISGSERTIGELLLDQRVVAGVGNVLRGEMLHQCGTHPASRGWSIRPEELVCL